MIACFTFHSKCFFCSKPIDCMYEKCNTKINFSYHIFN